MYLGTCIDRCLDVTETRCYLNATGTRYLTPGKDQLLGSKYQESDTEYLVVDIKNPVRISKC